jgi:hypothetical protein
VAFIGGSHSWRKHDHLVGHGKGVGKILVEPSMQAPGARMSVQSPRAAAPDRTVKSWPNCGPRWGAS